MNAKTIRVKVMGRFINVLPLKKVKDVYTVKYKGYQFEVKEQFVY